MDQISIRIAPSRIPLGRSIEASLVLFYTGMQALENLRGRIKVPASLRLVGLDSIHIPKVPCGEEFSVPIWITGEQPGLVEIHLSRLNARSVSGAVLNFEERAIEIEVSTAIELNPGNVTLTVEPVGLLVQNRISRVKCRLYNNFIFPLASPEITVSAPGGECYLGKNLDPSKLVPPGSFFEIDVQVLPKLPGIISLFTQVRFLIQQQVFTQEHVFALDVVRSKQAISRQRTSPAQQDTKTILLVSSSPQDQSVLRSDKEIKNILFEMKHSAPLRESFQVEVLPAATMDDLSREVIYLRPYLIHFSGHGSEQGILLENKDEDAKLLPTAALLALLKPLSGQVACVILNACETLDSARELAQCIPYVIGMRQAILDPAAIAFSKGLYEAIGAGHPMETSFEFGKARLIQDYFAETRNPVLFKQGSAV